MKIVFISALIVTLEAVVPVWHNGASRCGVSKYKDPGKQEEGFSSSVEPFGIAGGKTARRHEFPWMAGLVNSSKLWLIICGAAIINDRWVLTAAHCIYQDMNTWIKEIRVVVGEHNVMENATNNRYREYHSISRYFIADGFRANKTATINDVALLKLKSKISISQNVRPVCAPDTTKTYVYRQGVVAGWGNIEGGKIEKRNPTLRYARLNISNNSECGERIPSPEPFPENNMCATDDQGDIMRSHCHGDSGGPLVVQDARQTFSVVGIASSVWHDCLKGYPGNYARVSRFANWISDIIKNN